MKKIIYLFMLVSLYSCKDQKTKDIEKMQASVDKALKDAIFKQNLEADIKEFSVVKVDTLDENRLDSLRMFNNQKRIDYFIEESNRYIALMKNELSQMELQQSIGMTEGVNISKRDFEEHKNKATMLSDSVGYYQNINDSIEKRIQARKNPKTIYELKMFVKMILKKGKETENVLDTTYHHFDENINLIKD
ncbi:hypothetical protein [Pedobacter sp.]|uniref:hypothetical protein n=1 Tax=Pedobacter sp. TaxID=1411316 RepID=UPI00396CD70A